MLRLSPRQLLRRIKRKLLGPAAALPPATPPEGISLDPQGDANRNLAATSQRSLDNFLVSGTTLRVGGYGEGPLVSLVLVLFNKAHLTYACLLKLAQLQHSNLEVLIVVNHSSDQTSALLERLEGRITILREEDNLHFLRACNLAFDQLSPKSEFVGLVNNDALLDPAAISKALQVYRRWPDTGIVGGQILHLDGQLQEAGSAICRDGSCRGLGRRQTPWQPLVQTRRKVDYVSGCFLMIDAALLKKIGGFDTQFAPAYYEETDICVASWKLNRPVVYEPACLLHHVEFASSGQGRSDADSLMRTNQLLFKAKHNDWLASHPEPGQFRDLPNIDHALRHQAYPVRLLWIDDNCPDPSQGAGFGRLHTIFTSLADLGCFITLLATDLPKDGKAPDRSMHAVSADFELHWGREETLKDLLQQRPTFYTHVVASRRHNQEMLQTCLNNLPKDTPRPQVIADVESLFSIRAKSHDHLKRTGEIAMAQDLADHPMLHEELNALKEFDQLWAVSQLEADLLHNSGQQTVHLVSHSFAVSDRRPTPNNTAGLLFMGAMNHPGLPNLDSLLWLADAVLPALRLQPLQPEQAPLTVIGPYRDDLVRPLLERIKAVWPVIHLGAVAEVEPILRRHRVLLAPTRFAAGLPHKVQHGMAMGIPVVTTELIASQMGWSNGEGPMASNNAWEFASHIARLYNDPGLWEQVQAAGLACISRECHPQRQVDVLARSLQIHTQPINGA